MGKNKRILPILLALLMMASSVFAGGEELSLVFTHDMHDRVEAYDILEDGEIVNIGGYERLKGEIDRIREREGEILLVDGGDFSMGTLFQTIYSLENPSLRFLGRLGYDATTLGNHEFDFRLTGLTKALDAAYDSGDRLAPLVASNLDFENHEKGDKKEIEDFRESFERAGGRDYLIVEKKGIKIGIFGLLGYEAISNAPMAGIGFKDPVETAEEMVKKLREEEEVDLVLCLSHSGTKEKKSKSEDENLAKKVKGIDLIVSGHTHRSLDRPIKVGDTIIASAGRYTENLGSLKLERSGQTWKLKDYELIPLRGDYEESLKSEIDYFKDRIQKSYLDLFGLDYDQVLAETSFNFKSSKLLGKDHGEDSLANLIADSFRYAVAEAEKDSYRHVDFSIVPQGTIRDSFTKGEIRTKDIFNANSLGIGEDGISGYPLIDVYLTGKDMKTVAEVDASLAPLMKEAQLHISGLKYSFNPKRMILNKLVDIRALDQDGRELELEDDKLYRVVAGLYTGQMLNIVTDLSYGILSIVPKDEKGRPVENLEDRIIYQDSRELKEWYAVGRYLQSFDKKDSISQMDPYYEKTHDRKLVLEDGSLGARLKNPSKYALGLYGIVLGLLIVIFLLVKFIRRKRSHS